MTDAVFRTADAGEAVIARYRQVLDRWPVLRQERLVETRHGATFVVSCGPEDGPPVVLLHGSQANSAAWMFDAELWSRRFRLHAVDLIGEPGLSARVQPPLASEYHARWLDDVLHGLGLSRTALVGTSLGGWMALDFATRRPGVVTALVLYCPGGIGRQKNFLLKALPLMLLGPWGADKVRGMVFGPRPAAEGVSDDFRAFGELMEAAAQAVRPRTLALPHFNDGQLAALEMPVLAIVGGRDALLDSRETRDRLRALVPHAEVDYIADGYHYLPGQGARVMEFLERALTGPNAPV